MHPAVSTDCARQVPMNLTTTMEHHEFMLFRYGSLQLQSTGPSTCVTAAEGKDATVTCPEGQHIVSVQFASYGCFPASAARSLDVGTPQGTCLPDGGNSFKADPKCDSTDSKHLVESACIGKAQCQVSNMHTVSAHLVIDPGEQ